MRPHWCTDIRGQGLCSGRRHPGCLRPDLHGEEANGNQATAIRAVTVTEAEEDGSNDPSNADDDTHRDGDLANTGADLVTWYVSGRNKSMN